MFAQVQNPFAQDQALAAFQQTSEPPRLTYLEAASRIGARLCRDALWHGERCTWLGAAMEAVDGEWKILERSFGGDLYGGTAGIGLFLARLHRAAPDPLLARTAEGALRQAVGRAEATSASSRLGFYTGGTGIAYALTELGDVLGEERWLEEASKLLGRLAKADRQGHVLDVVAGTAGAVAPLLELSRRLDSPDLTDLAVELGDELIGLAHRRREGWSWDTLVDTSGFLRDHMTGFSHGVSGVVWAMLELFAATGEARFREAAEEGMRYERHWFDSAEGNWPDLRRYGQGGPNPDPEPLAFPVQWCHGAAGIGLVRLRAVELLGEAGPREEAEAALRTTWRSLEQDLVPDADGPTANDSLCHGRAGNAELLLLAARVLGEPRFRDLAEAVGRRGLDTFEGRRLPWPSGLQGRVPTLGLMLGLAGTGYFLLRLADPESTPSILFPVPGG